jgi:hypothetical protein
MTETIITPCPHCFEEILIFKNEINCNKFVHGYYKDTMEQINPHLNKETCQGLLNQGKIIGCGGAFKLIENNEILEAVICEHG